MEKAKELLNRLAAVVREMMEENRSRVSWSNLAAMLASIVTLEVYRSIGSAIAEYQGKEVIYVASYVITAVIIIIAFWEFCCLAVNMRAGSLRRGLGRMLRRGCERFKAWPVKRKWATLTAAVALAVLVFAGIKCFIFDYCRTEYYASVIEVYGLPDGVGAPLTEDERNNRAGYYRIDHYPVRRRFVLTYVDAYQQPEIMRQYSSAYDMQLFQPPARVEYTYVKDKDIFRSCDQDGFLVAKEHKYRVPVQVSYYDSNGKLLLELGRKDNDKFLMEMYSSGDAPQLLNSTLLRIPDGQGPGNGLASQQIETLYNSEGFPMLRRLKQGTCNLYGVNGERYSYDKDGRLISLYYLNGDGEPTCNKSGIMLISFKYDDDGNLASVRYYSDEEGTEKTEGFHGVFCEKFDYDSFNRLIERKQLDRTENWSCDENGVYRYEYTYAGNALEEEFYWGLNEPAWNERSGSHSLTFRQEQTEEGKVLSISFDLSSEPVRTVDSPKVMAVSFGANVSAKDRTVLSGESDMQGDPQSSTSGSPISMDNGAGGSRGGQAEMEDGTGTGRKYAMIQYVIGDKTLEMRYCDADKQPMTNGQGYAARKVEYDSKMRVIKESYLDVNGEPCYIQGGYAAVRRFYDVGREDRIICLEYLDINNNLTYNMEAGYAMVQYDYTPQDKGEKITRMYCGVDRKPCSIQDKGYAIIEDLYNESGFLIQKIYKDAEGVVTCRQDCMAAEILYEYAGDGNLIRESYRNAEGRPVNRADTGYAVVYQEFEGGRLVRKHYEGYVDQTLRAVTDREMGVSTITYLYEKGEKQEEHYFDASGKPVLRRDIGCAAISYEYNSEGQLLAEYYYGTDGGLILRSDTGCALTRCGYDGAGRRISYRYYGVDEEPVVNTKYHCAGMDYVYGERGTRSEIRYIGLDGSSLMNREDFGIALIRQEYDEFGNLSGESYFDENERPAIRKDCGYASYKAVYENAKLVEKRCLDTEGNLMLCRDEGYAVKIREYDEYGRYIRCCFLGTDEEPVISTKYNCAELVYQYDNKGNMEDIFYKGTDGELINRTDYGIAKIHRTYDETGNRVEEFYYDADGSPALRKEYGYAYCINTYKDGYLMETRYFDTDDELILRKDTGYAIIRYEYDEYGQKVSEYFYGVNDEPVISTKYHCAGFCYAYDRMGNTTDTWYIGLDGNLVNRSDFGFARAISEYDAVGNLTEQSYYDTEGRPAIWKDYGYASFEKVYEKGLLTEQRYYDAEGHPALRKDVGCAVIEYEYNQNGQKQFERYYDIDEAPVIAAEYRCAGIEYTYDEIGNLDKLSYLGLNDELINRDDYGFAVIYKVYNDVGTLIGESYYDTEGNPTIWKEYGYASYRSIYENGRRIETGYYDTEGNLTLRKDTGYAVDKSIYDEYGREISWTFYDADENPVINTEYHCAGFEYAYDARSNRTEIRSTGLDGGLMNRTDCGVARVCQMYDAADNLTGESYYNTEGQPAVWKVQGYASYQDVYTDGKCVESRYFGIDGNLILREDTGYAVLRREYNAYGQKISESYYGTVEQPVISTKYYCAKIDYVYDDKGNNTEFHYLGLDGSPINRSDYGISILRKEYDASGNLTGESYYDTEGQPAARKEYGYASYRDTYENGNVVECRYFDAGGNLVLRKDTGCAVIRYQYDELNRYVGCRYYGTEEEPVVNTDFCCAGMDFTYDEKGYRIRTRYLGTDGSLMNRSDFGIAQIEKEYDIYGNLSGEAYYDTEGNPAPRAEYGYASYKDVYEKGNWAEGRYYDTKGNLILRKDTGYAMVKYGYNDLGQRVWERYYDADGEYIVSTESHCAGISYSYDDRSNQTTTWYMDPDWQICVRDDWEAGVEYRVYDQYDNLLRKAYYTYSDEQYQPVIRKDLGYAAVEYTYDGNGNWINCRYFNAEGNPVICPEEGYAVCERRYNDKEQLAAEIYYDEHGEPVNSVNGYAMREYIYDASGKVTESRRYDKSEVPERLENL